MIGEEEDEGQNKGDAGSGTAADADSESRPWFPWACGEMFWREFINMYSHADGSKKTAILDLTPGCGMLALAAARSQTRYVGFCLNQVHAATIMEALTVAVAVEIARNTNDGFLARRVLSKSHSLGGSTDADVNAEEARKALEKSTPAKGVSKPTDDEKSSSDDSGSDD